MTIPQDLLTRFQGEGLRTVQAKQELGLYAGKKKKYAALYIAQCIEEREAEAAEREEDRTEEALSISRSANSIASEAVRIARHERLIAIIAAVAAIAAAIATAYMAYVTSASVS